jgi:hypothetical protein
MGSSGMIFQTNLTKIRHPVKILLMLQTYRHNYIIKLPLQINTDELML